MNSVTYSPSDTFSTTSDIFGLAMLILVQSENEQSQVYIFQGTYFESSQIHLLTIMYHFEHKNQDILLNFLFQNL